MKEFLRRMAIAALTVATVFVLAVWVYGVLMNISTAP